VSCCKAEEQQDYSLSFFPTTPTTSHNERMPHALADEVPVSPPKPNYADRLPETTKARFDAAGIDYKNQYPFWPGAYSFLPLLFSHPSFRPR
jgi:hypothetical protein